MIAASFLAGVKVVFEAMKSLVQLEISRCILSKLACFHKRILQRAGSWHVSLSLQRQYCDHLEQAF